MKPVLVVQHAACESLASNFTGVLKEMDFELVPLHFYEYAPNYDTFPAPHIDQVSFIIILGGPQSANDPYPAFRQEQAYIKRAIDHGKPVFGICLGAQMMAKALGGRIEPTGGYQFGLRKIYITREGNTDPVFGKLHIPLVPTLHGECFSIPPGAAKLAESFILRRNGTYGRINMAFRYQDSYAFQFEPQLTLEELKVWNRELFDDYKMMGNNFDPEEEATRNLREFAKYEPYYRQQTRELFQAFLSNADLIRRAPRRIK